MILSNNETDYIIEMNNSKTNSIFEKNIDYLFRQHSRKVSKKNNYGKNKFTYLINIDNYDILNKNDLIYDSTINFPKYNKTLYQNIKIKHINLAYLKKKIYNGIKENELNYLEKYLLLFVCQNVNEIRRVIKCKEIEGVINIMFKMKLENDFITTYDKNELDRMIKEEFERDKKKFIKDKKELNKDKIKLNKDKEELNKDKEELNKDKEELNKDKNEFYKEKSTLAKELKKLGLSLERISELTKISIDNIKML